MAQAKSTVSFKVKGDKALQRDFARFAKQKAGEISNILDAEALNIQTIAKKKVPVDENRLRPSIRIKRSELLRREIGSEVEYALYVEKGTKPHTPPIDPLKEWAGRVLGDESAAWLVQKKIGEEGTDPSPFMGPAFFMRRRKIIRKIKSLLGDAGSFPTLREK